MKCFKSVLHKYKLSFVIVLVSLTSILTYSFVDNNFEISKNLDVFTTLFRELNSNYVDDINPGEFMKKGIDAMLKTLDPYTVFIPESEIEDYKMMTTGQYGGIGAMVHKQGDKIVITEPYENSPAFKAGLRAGDVIIEVNGNSVKGKSVEDVHKIMQGQQGTVIKFMIKREGIEDTFEKAVVKEKIKIDNIPYYGMLNDKIAYIKLSGFTQNAGKDVKKAFLKLKEGKDVKGLVFDLRGNGGGLLIEAVNICNIFIEKNELIVSTKAMIKERNISYRTYSQPVDLKIPLVILVDKNSASASEIVAGAMQDLDRAIIIGQRTFGKGLVQNIFPVSYNSQVKITVAKYYIPSGRCIQAIDYSHKDEEGYFTKIPDSLITKFKTKNGRDVYDGGGIVPDIEMKKAKLGSFPVTLIQKHHIFNFSTLFRISNDSIETPKDFRIYDEVFNNFISYLDGKDYDYTLRSEKALKQYKEQAEKENYFDAVKAEYGALMKKIQNDKDKDIYKYKEEIKFLLKDEIVSRYYYRSGRIESSLSEDEEIKKAIKILEIGKEYFAIINGTKKKEE